MTDQSPAPASRIAAHGFEAPHVLVEQALFSGTGVWSQRTHYAGAISFGHCAGLNPFPDSIDRVVA